MADQLMTVDGDANQAWLKAREAIGAHARRSVPRYEKLWAYYRNPIELIRASGAAIGVNGATRGWYRSAQEVGLPARIVGRGTSGDEHGRREVVIENDIGWRVAAMVDFMFGSPIRIESLAENESTKNEIEDVLERVWESSGGIALLQDMATLGHVFGHVDLLVRVDEEGLVGSRVQGVERYVSIEPIDARRGVARGYDEARDGLGGSHGVLRGNARQQHIVRGARLRRERLDRGRVRGGSRLRDERLENVDIPRRTHDGVPVGKVDRAGVAAAASHRSRHRMRCGGTGWTRCRGRPRRPSGRQSFCRRSTRRSHPDPPPGSCS